MTKSQQNKTTKMLNLCENHLFKLKKKRKKNAESDFKQK
jgi:hypothetical protein